MAVVKLKSKSSLIVSTDLPELCVYCGAPSQAVISMAFRYVPRDAMFQVLGYLTAGIAPWLLSLSTARRVRTTLPVCRRHHWWFRRSRLGVRSISERGILTLGGVSEKFAAAVFAREQEQERQPIPPLIHNLEEYDWQNLMDS